MQLYAHLFSRWNFAGIFKSHNSIILPIFLIESINDTIIFAYPFFNGFNIGIICKEAQRSRVFKSYLTNAGILLRQTRDSFSLRGADRLNCGNVEFPSNHSRPRSFNIPSPCHYAGAHFPQSFSLFAQFIQEIKVSNCHSPSNYPMPVSINGNGLNIIFFRDDLENAIHTFYSSPLNYGCEIN